MLITLRLYSFCETWKQIRWTEETGSVSETEMGVSLSVAHPFSY